MTYEWQDKQNFVNLNDFVQFLPRTNFVGGASENLSASAKICQVATNYPHLVVTEILSKQTAFSQVRIGPLSVSDAIK